MLIFQKISFFQGKCWICWILGGGLLNKNVLLSGEMLNMLNVLGKDLGTPPPLSSSSPPKNSTYSTFPLKEAHFLKKMLLSAEMLNMLNSGGPVESKCASFCRNVEYVECFGENLGTPPLSSSSPQNIHLSTFLQKNSIQYSTFQHFPWKKHIFSKKCFFQGKCWICWILGGLLNKNVLLSGEMLNMLNMLNVLGRAWGPRPLIF